MSLEISNQRRAVVAWLIGGLPLVVSTLQAGNALSGRTSLFWIPVIGDIAEAVSSFDVVIAAARIFYGQTTIIFALFLLIAAAWLAQGILMFTSTGREKSFSRTASAGTVVLSALLYGFLFLGIYASLLTADIGLAQRAGFFLIPVIATGCLSGAYYQYSWKGSRRAEAVSRLNDAEDRVQKEQRRLEDALNSLPLERLESISPEPVKNEVQTKNEFEEKCDELLSEIRRSINTSDTTNIETLENRSHTLQQRANELDASTVVNDLDKSLRDTLDSVIDERFQDVSSEVVSSYGTQYDIGNLPQKYRTVEVPDSTEVVTLTLSSSNAIAEQLHNVVDQEGISLQQSIELIEKVDDRLQNEVIPHLQSYEDDLQEIESQITEDITRANDKIEDVGGYTQNALERLFISGTVGEETKSADDIHRKLDEAIEELHACHLDQAIETAQTARTMAEEYMEAVRFIHSVLIPGIERGETTITSVPAEDTREHGFFSLEVIENLREPIRNDYGVNIQMDNSTRTVSVDHEFETSETKTTGVQEPTSSSVKDAVKYVIREIQDAAGEGDVPDEATISLDALPSSVRETEPVPEFVEFIESSNHLTVTEVPDQTDGEDGQEQVFLTEGYLSVRAENDETITQAVDGLIEEYRAWANRRSDA